MFLKKCEGDLAAEKATPTACETPTLLVCLSRQDRGSEEAELPEPGLDRRCSQRQGLFPLETDAGGLGETGRCIYIYIYECKHIHAHTETCPSSSLITSIFQHRLHTSVPRQGPTGLLSPPKAQTPRIPHASVRKRSQGIRGQAESEP